MYFVGHNAEDVTGSTTYIRYNGKQILLEMGIFQSNDYLEDYQINSRKFPFNPSEIDYVFINHVHADHCGLLPRLVAQGFRGKIITTHTTAVLMKPLLLNCAFILESEANVLSRKYHREYKPLYSEADVYQTLDLIYEYDSVHTSIMLDDVVSFEWINNSHCLGAKQLRLSLKGINNTKHVLYTSDLGALSTDNHYVDDTEIDPRFNDLTIMESTYGEQVRQSKKTRQFDIEHLKSGIDTTLEQGGTVLMPCFSFSRTQEILTTLYEIYHNDPSFDYPIVVDSILSNDICNLYDTLLADDDAELWAKVRNWNVVKFVRDKDESLSYVKTHQPKVVLSSSGFCTNGRILSYLHEYLGDAKSMVIFSGYVGGDNSYLSYRIKNYKDNKFIKISGDPVANLANCMSLSTFSSHATRKDLIKFGSAMNTNKLVLVHGSTAAKNSLKPDLQKAISKADKTFKVVASTLGMYIKL